MPEASGTPVRGRVHRAVVLALSCAVAIGSIFVPAHVFAQQSETPAEKAAREIQAARDRANAAAQAMFDAESEFDTLTVEIGKSEAELAVIEAEAAEMRAGLQDGAVYNFVAGGTGSFPLLIDLDATNDELAADVFVDVAYGNAAVELDDYDAVADELEAARTDLEQQREDASAAEERFAQLKVQAEEEVVRLAEVEKDRVEDEAVQRELQRQREARIAAETAAAEATQTAANQAAADEAASNQAASSQAATNSGGSNSNSNSGGGSSAPAPEPSSGSNSNEAVEAPTEAPVQAPVEVAPPSNAGSGIVCPVAGPRSFGDTWGPDVRVVAATRAST